MSVKWHWGVNTKVMRESSWTDSVGTIADDTRAGTKKVRMANTYAPKQYSISMRFTLEEYAIFKNWFEITTRRGAIPFEFPDIETSHPTFKFSEDDNNVLYRFTPSSQISYRNSAGLFVDVSMEWETV